MSLTPPYFHFKSLKIHLHPEVYEPAEDTFLLLETIHITPEQKVLEIGAGTGIISLYSAQQGAHVICSDINPYATQLITKNIQENRSKLKGTIEVRKGDLFTVVQNNEVFHMIIFNPPYLPTTKEEKRGISEWYAASFDGGPSGLTVTTRFLNGLHVHLHRDGQAFFVYSSLSPKNIIEKTCENLSLSCSIVNQLRCDDEMLKVYNVTKMK